MSASAIVAITFVLWPIIVAWACCIVAADADARSQKHQREAQGCAERGRGVDVHTDFSLTKRDTDHA